MSDTEWIPQVERDPWGLICLVCNFLPGVGTLLAAGRGNNKLNIALGLAQLLLFWTILMWIWSVVWGILIYRKST